MDQFNTIIELRQAVYDHRLTKAMVLVSVPMAC